MRKSLTYTMKIEGRNLKNGKEYQHDKIAWGDACVFIYDVKCKSSSSQFNIFTHFCLYKMTDINRTLLTHGYSLHSRHPNKDVKVGHRPCQ